MNRNVYQINSPIIISVLLIISLFLNGCFWMRVEYEKADIKQASSYKYSCNKSGLIISVDPYIEEERVDKVFRYDLLSKGILPVLVVFENKDAEDGYVLLKDQSKLLLKNYKSQDTEDKLNDKISLTEEISDSHKKELATGVGLFLITSVFVDSLIADSFRIHRENLVSVFQNLSNIELKDKTVYAGGTHSGFLYVKFTKREDIKYIEGFLFTLKNIRTDKTQTIKIEIQ